MLGIWHGGLRNTEGVYVDKAGKNETIEISGLICPLPQHVGKTGDIYVGLTMTSEGSYAYGFLRPDGQLSQDPVAFRESILLNTEVPLTIFSGIVGFTVSKAEIFVGYSVTSEAEQTRQVYADLPGIRFSVE